MWKGRGRPSNKPCIRVEAQALEDNDINGSTEHHLAMRQVYGAKITALRLPRSLLLTNLDQHLPELHSVCIAKRNMENTLHSLIAVPRNALHVRTRLANALLSVRPHCIPSLGAARSYETSPNETKRRSAVRRRV